MTRLTLMTLPPSPYNTKVRLALKLKGLDFAVDPVDPADRRKVVARTGQPLTPVLLDGERAIYDSFGILRYLDANFGGPKLFSETRDGQREIQGWEDFSKLMGSALGLVAGQAFSGQVDEEATARARNSIAEYAERIEAALEGREYLMGDQPNAADLSVASFLQYVVAEPTQYPEDSFMRFVAARLELDPRFARTKAWAERVLALDAVPVG